MSAKQKVLIVDDESRNQRIITETLDDQYEHRVAASGEAALAMIEDFAPDLVLLDIMMPGIDGYEVCQKIRANPKCTFTKVILVSGKAMIDERLKGYEVGADDYMTKPFTPEELLAKTRVFLRLTQTERQLSDLNHSLEEKVRERTRQLLETEAKLVNSAKMSALGEMAGGIAHEINTPLATIGLLVGQINDLANEEPVDRASIIEMTKVQEETVSRISKIINGLRTFSRDGSQDRFDSIPIKQVISDTLTLCQERLKHANVDMQIHIPEGEIQIQCRPVQISQVLLNIIGNACDAIEKQQEKWIKISVERKNGAAQISVTDSGPGIPETVRAKLFQPFFTTKEIGKGTGLGLSISKGIMDAHQGTLSIDKDCSNTRFVLRLPEHQTENVAKIKVS